MTEQAIPLLDPAAHVPARRVVDALASLDPVGPVLNHGDLAGANVLWASPHPTTLQRVPPPSEHGTAGTAITHTVPAELLRRAEAFHDSFPLQLVCHAIITSRGQDELDRAINGANRRLLTLASSV